MGGVALGLGSSAQRCKGHEARLNAPVIERVERSPDRRATSLRRPDARSVEVPWLTVG